MKFTNSFLLASASLIFSLPVHAETAVTVVKDLRAHGEATLTEQDPASEAKAVTINALPDSGSVKVNGMVDSVSSARKFTLKDQTGQVDVSMQSDPSASLKKGVEVSVTGNVDKGAAGKTIAATEVLLRTGSAPMAAK